MWMSEASAAIASSIRRLTSRTTGASKAMSRRWLTSSSRSPSPSRRAPCPRRSSAARCRRRRCARWPPGWPGAGATQSLTVRRQGLAQLVDEERIRGIGRRDGRAVRALDARPGTRRTGAGTSGDRFLSTGGVEGSSSAGRKASCCWAASARSTSFSVTAPSRPGPRPGAPALGSPGSALPGGPPPRWRGHAPGSCQAAADEEEWSPRWPDFPLHQDAPSIVTSFKRVSFV